MISFIRGQVVDSTENSVIVETAGIGYEIFMTGTAIEKAVRSEGKVKIHTYFHVPHSMEDIAKTADRVLVMDDSREAMFDSTRAVFARGDELEQMGLRVPQITKIMSVLKEKGWPVDPVLTVEQAVRQLLPLLQKGGA